MERFKVIFILFLTASALNGCGDSTEVNIDIDSDPELLAIDDSVTIRRESSVEIDVLSNDVTLAGSETCVTQIESPANSPFAASINEDCSITIIPIDYTASHSSLTYVIQSNDGQSASAQLHISIINSAPSWIPYEQTQPDDTVVTIDLTNYVSDADEDSLSFDITDIENGSVTLTGTSLELTPHKDFFGQIPVSVSADDGYGGKTSSVFHFTFSPSDISLSLLESSANKEAQIGFVIESTASSYAFLGREAFAAGDVNGDGIDDMYFSTGFIGGDNGKLFTAALLGGGFTKPLYIDEDFINIDGDNRHDIIRLSNLLRFTGDIDRDGFGDFLSVEGTIVYGGPTLPLLVDTDALPSNVRRTRQINDSYRLLGERFSASASQYFTHGRSNAHYQLSFGPESYLSFSQSSVQNHLTETSNIIGLDEYDAGLFIDVPSNNLPGILHHFRPSGTELNSGTPIPSPTFLGLNRLSFSSFQPGLYGINGSITQVNEAASLGPTTNIGYLPDINGDGINESFIVNDNQITIAWGNSDVDAAQAINAVLNESDLESNPIGMKIIDSNNGSVPFRWLNTIGDINGDGQIDLALSGHNYASVSSIDGIDSSGNFNFQRISGGNFYTDISNTATYLILNPSDIRVLDISDVNADASQFDDVIVIRGFYSESETASNQGAGDGAGLGIAGIGDINNDGFDDFAIGSPFYSRHRGIFGSPPELFEGTLSGRLSIFFGGAKWGN